MAKLTESVLRKIIKEEIKELASSDTKKKVYDLLNQRRGETVDFIKFADENGISVPDLLTVIEDQYDNFGGRVMPNWLTLQIKVHRQGPLSNY